MAKLTLNTISSGYASNTALNVNFGLIETALENTLSRDGTTPNTMTSDLDMNGNRILNQLAQSGDGFIWYGAWVTSTSYAINNLVSNSGKSYICTEAHTSGTFGTDLSAGKWELLADQGAAGAGTGDMLKSENLSGLADNVTALATIGAAPLAGATFTGLVNQAAGANIASAATVDLTAATGNSPRITGITATSAFTMNTGQQMWLVADGAWPLTYHATTNKINGGVSYTCAAGDRIHVVKDLSGVIQTTVFKADGTAVVGAEAFTDYSATSTIVGWSSYTTKQIYYKVIDDLVFVNVALSGTSNSTSVTFTLPYAAATGSLVRADAAASDNGTNLTTPAKMALNEASSTVTVTKDMASGAWTGSGTKTVTGQFFYIKA